MLYKSRSLLQWFPRRSLVTLVSSFSPMKSLVQPLATSAANTSVSTFQRPSVISLVFGLNQRRWKSRGNTFQPSTLKRKRRVGFLARARSKTGQKILKRRKEKGRWYLTY
ncbi:mitochondrial 54S ribosomal protein bL34m Ecym_4303 [Eremothecium cymbalariae DBVPG|uniref:Large ribosomal subunit protein bL34m n=1 Tax=Eremothecium cymbalariae (strain CBS 270.75 / DBVPG 7215 / KCTC 17166 / NRRL Y-17582) TaxID=931890 RepID=G8JTL3_ERECY|nr:hypothetical protein Ecym_4303 [Eremothecium cymbalariae DBVPG\